MLAEITTRAENTVTRLYKGIPIRLAGDVHSRLKSSPPNALASEETRALVRQSLRKAGMVQKTA